MNRAVVAIGAVAVMAVGSMGFVAGVTVEQQRKPRVYELRTYTTLPGRLPLLHKRFADHTLALFEKHGMRNEQYFTPTDTAKAKTTLIYLLSHESEEAANRSWKAFSADSAWITVRNSSEADGRILEKSPERVFMKLAPFSPAP